MISERQAVVLMAAFRALTGMCELTVAILATGSLKLAIRLNAFLGIVGPVVFFLAMLVGVGGLVGRVSWWRLTSVMAGIILVIIGLVE